MILTADGDNYKWDNDQGILGGMVVMRNGTALIVSRLFCNPIAKIPFPSTVNNQIVNTFHELLAALKTTETYIQQLNSIFQDTDGSYKMMDTSGNGNHVELNSSCAVGNGIDNYLKTGINASQDLDFKLVGRFTDLSDQYQQAGAKTNTRYYLVAAQYGVLYAGMGGQYVSYGNADLNIHTWEKIGDKLFYDGTEVLSNISITAEAGEIYALGIQQNDALTFRTAFEMYSLEMTRASQKLISLNGRNNGGSNVYSQDGTAYPIEGSRQNFWQLSKYAEPINLTQGADIWTNSTEERIYMQIGVTCQEVGYTYFKTIQPTTSGLNDSETTITQNANVSAARFDVNPWTVPLTYDNLVANYENKDIWKLDFVNNNWTNWRVVDGL